MDAEPLGLGKCRGSFTGTCVTLHGPLTRKRITQSPWSWEASGDFRSHGGTELGQAPGGPT